MGGLNTLANIYEKLMLIQNELKCPKDQFNSFGKYHYRSAESILEALKPLLVKHKATLIISDEIVLIGDRFYVKATARLLNTEEPGEVEVTAYAREAENKKGMDSAQVTGSTSSYARKYALNGLLAIDDNKDPDHLNRGQENQTRANRGNPRQQRPRQKPMTLEEAKSIKLNFGDFNNISLGQLAKENIGAVKELYQKANDKKNKYACGLILKDYKRQVEEAKRIEKATEQSDFFDKDFKPVQE